MKYIDDAQVIPIAVHGEIGINTIPADVINCHACNMVLYCALAIDKEVWHG